VSSRFWSCLGGGYAMRAAATDPRIKAVAGIAGGYNSPSHFADQMRAAAHRRVLGTFLAATTRNCRLWRPVASYGRRRTVRLLRHRPIDVTVLGEPGHPRVAALPDDLRCLGCGSAPVCHSAAHRARRGRGVLRQCLPANCTRALRGQKRPIGSTPASTSTLRVPKMTSALVTRAGPIEPPRLTASAFVDRRSGRAVCCYAKRVSR
jgi:hypothetical protein